MLSEILDLCIVSLCRANLGLIKRGCFGLHSRYTFFDNLLNHFWNFCVKFVPLVRGSVFLILLLLSYKYQRVFCIKLANLGLSVTLKPVFVVMVYFSSVASLSVVRSKRSNITGVFQFMGGVFYCNGVRASFD